MTPQPNDSFFIVMVDDDEEDIYTMKRAFSSLEDDIRFEAVSSADDFFELLDALEVATDASPDLVLLDLNIPTVSGFEILERLRQGAAGGRGSLVPVMIFSTSDTDEDATRCYLLGANAVFTKPTNFEGTTRIARAVVDFWRTEGIRRIDRFSLR